MKRIFFGLAVLSMAGCVTSPPRLVNQMDSQVEFAKLGKGGKQIAETFYDLGSGDTVKRMYWAQRRMQEQGRSDTADAPPVQLQRRYVNIPVPAHTDPDGTEIEAATHAVEVVQWVSFITKHGKRINLCN